MMSNILLMNPPNTGWFDTFQMFMFGYVGLIVVLSVWKYLEDVFDNG